MAKMCNLGSNCKNSAGMCIHEKIMIGMVMVAALAGVAYWLA
ncbi:MAG: hypothetical protein Kow0074_16810 [Candidatus Zixiibacteriota bacterium]